MALTVLTGRANSGKTGVAYGAVSSAIASGASPALLLPTRPDVARAVAELSRRHPMGVRVQQLDDWARELWSLHGDGRAPVEPEQRVSILGEVVARSRLTALGSSSRTPGFVGLLGRLARMAAEEPPEALEARSRGAVEGETARLLAAYRTALEGEGLIEPAAAARLLADRPPRLEGPAIVHRFSDLSASQEALLIAIAAQNEVLVSLPWERAFPATEALDGLVARLVAAGEHRHLPAAGADDELSRLEAGLFTGPEAGPADGAVRFCTAAGAEAEATLIAAEAAEAARRFGADRVAIVFRDAAPHVERVRRALGGAGVAADLDVLVPFARTSLGAALLHLVRCVLAREGTGSLVAFLRSPFSGAEPDAVDALDARWRGLPGLPTVRAIREAARVGPPVGRALSAARRVSDPKASCQKWQELADALLSAAYGPCGLREDAEATIDAASHRALLEAVSRLSALRRGGISAQEVLVAVDELRVPAGPSERPGHVQVTEAHRLRGRRFDAVIVGGLTTGDFSAEGRASAASEIAARLFGSRRASEQAAERLLFYTVCTRARRSLVLTRQTTDSDGEARRPSVFWEEALDLYRRPDADAGAEAEDAVIAARVRLSDLERAAPALTRGRLERRLAADGSRGPGAPRSRGDRLHDTGTLGWLAARHDFSATELETYARCPYRWFYERAVRPESLDVGLDARSRGDLAHRTLATFYGDTFRRLGVPRVTHESLARALDLADEAFEREVSAPETPPATSLLEQDEIARVRSWVRSAVAEDVSFLEGYEPAYVELRFGIPAVDGAGRAPVDLGGYALRGSIDRVDAGGAGLVVIDYKTGSAVPRLADIEGERRIQVPLYAAAAERLLGRPVVAGLYRSLKAGGARGYFRAGAVGGPGLTSTDALDTAEDVERIVSSAVEMGLQAADGIRAGAIPAIPASAGACAYCPASGFCGGGA